MEINYILTYEFAEYWAELLKHYHNLTADEIEKAENLNFIRELETLGISIQSFFHEKKLPNYFITIRFGMISKNLKKQ